MGVYQSEMGFLTTIHEINYINANLKLVCICVIKPMKLSGWIRAIASDVEKAVELTRIRHLDLSISTSKLLIEGKFQGKNHEDDILNMMVEAVKLARDYGIKTIGVNDHI